MEYSIVTFIAHEFKAGYVIGNEEHVGEIEEMLLPSDVKLDDVIEKIPLEQISDEHFLPYSRTEPVYRLKQDLIAFEVEGYAGNSNDGMICSGVAWEVHHIGIRDTFEDYYEELVKLALPRLEKARKHNPDQYRRDGETSCNFMTLWSYESGMAWDGEWDVSYDLVGALDAKKLSLALVTEPEVINVSDNDENLR